jgi:hypothetical protein
MDRTASDEEPDAGAGTRRTLPPTMAGDGRSGTARRAATDTAAARAGVGPRLVPRLKHKVEHSVKGESGNVHSNVQLLAQVPRTQPARSRASL